MAKEKVMERPFQGPVRTRASIPSSGMPSGGGLDGVMQGESGIVPAVVHGKLLPSGTHGEGAASIHFPFLTVLRCTFRMPFGECPGRPRT